MLVSVVYGVDCGLCDWLIARVGLSYRGVDVCVMSEKSQPVGGPGSSWVVEAKGKLF